VAVLQLLLAQLAGQVVIAVRLRALLCAFTHMDGRMLTRRPYRPGTRCGRGRA
jgi:hypothetical protein